jgi:uncharacterized protein with ParB-like and HNH nuclease domain
MKAESRTLQRIFEPSIRYCVPLFQRPYVWNQSANWEPPWEDIRRLAEQALVKADGNRTHFVGAIVVEQLPGATGSIDTRQIIDGQQRLTTLQILLTVLKDLSRERNWEVFKKRFEKYSRNDAAFIDAPHQAFKVWPTNPDRLAFQLTLEAGTVNALKRSLAENALDGHVINDLLPKAYQYFWGTISEWIAEKEDQWPAEKLVETLWNVLSGQLRLVAIDLEQGDDAQVIFETLNSRGAPLLPGDLVKNYLFRQAQVEGLEVQPLYDRYWKAFDDEWWRTEMRQGRLKRPRLDIFLQHYLSLKTRDDVLVTHIFETYRKFAESSGLKPKQLIEDLAEYGRVFKRLVNPHEHLRVDLFLNRLISIDTATIYPFLLEAFRLYDTPEHFKELAAIAETLESFLVRRIACHLTTKNYNRLFLELLAHCEASGGVSHAALREFLLKSDADTARWPTDAELRKAIESDQLYRLLTKARLRLLLRAINQAIESEKSEDIQLPEDLTVEHLLPQRWQQHWPLRAIDEAEKARATQRRDQLKHTLGNLTLLTKKLNPSVSNSAWTTKRPEITKQSKLNLNREFHTISEWTEKQIEERGKRFADILLTLWPRNGTPI